jgi:hypothetical protein
MTEITLKTDPPHAPQYTRQLAGAVAESVRCLNHATFTGADGLMSPADAESVLADLGIAATRLPQLFGQVKDFLMRQAGTGDLADSGGADVRERVAAAAYQLGRAHGAAGDLATALQRAQGAVSGLYLEGDDDD